MCQNISASASNQSKVIPQKTHGPIMAFAIVLQVKELLNMSRTPGGVDDFTNELNTGI